MTVGVLLSVVDMMKRAYRQKRDALANWRRRRRDRAVDIRERMALLYFRESRTLPPVACCIIG
jgi:hypothetical protein